MPTRFLSDAEIERLEGWPEVVERCDMVRYFAPDGDDLAFVREQRGAPNQLAVALQLGALRWLGFVPEELTAAPPDAVAMLADTLDLSPRRSSTMRSGRRRGVSIDCWSAATRGFARSRKARSNSSAIGSLKARSSTSGRRCCWVGCGRSFGVSAWSVPRSIG
jgi:hypothetical protein